MKQFICSLMFIVFTAASALCQIPRTISYQGVISDSLGIPLPDGEHVFSYSLFDNSTGGSHLWSEQHTVQLQRGLFSVILGSVNPFPDSMRFEKAYWLEIACDRCAPMSPRIQMTAVGYSLNSVRSDTALYAFNAPGAQTVDSARIAGTVADNAVNSGKIADGSIQRDDVHPAFKAPFADTADAVRTIPPVGFADSARTAGMVPDGSITAEKIGDGQIVRSINQLKDNVVLTAEGGATITSSGDTITIHAGTGSADSTGIFGIQTTNNTLDVLNPNGPTTTVNVKNAGIGTAQLADNAVTGAKILNGAISFADIGQNSAGNGDVIKWTGSAWAASADNVGTNTSGWTDHGTYTGLTSPTDSVKLNTNSTLGKLAINGSIGLIGQRSIFFDNEDTYITKLSTGDLRIGAMDGQLRLLGEDMNVLMTGDISFGHYGDELWAAFDNTNKRFGIGTLSPIDRLTVANANASACWLRIQGTHATNWGQTGLRIQTPVNTWHLRQDLYTHANFPEGALSLYSSGGSTETMTWLEDGKVGVGTTNPLKKLDVNGSVQVRDTLFADALQIANSPRVSYETFTLARTITTVNHWGPLDTITVEAPGPGFVILNFSGTLYTNHTYLEGTWVGVSISTGPTSGVLAQTWWEFEHQLIGGYYQTPCALNTVATVTSGGTLTYYLDGYHWGTSGEEDVVHLNYGSFSALFIPAP